jgi:hypothetical protein
MNVVVGTCEMKLSVKARRPWAVAALTTVTLGVYSVVWWYKINREMHDFGVARGDRELAASRPWRSVAAMTLGHLIVIPEVLTIVRTVRRVHAVERIGAGARRPAAAATALLLGSVAASLATAMSGATALWPLGLLMFAAGAALAQRRLNAVWQTHDAAAPSPVATLTTPQLD